MYLHAVCGGYPAGYTESQAPQNTAYGTHPTPFAAQVHSLSFTGQWLILCQLLVLMSQIKRLGVYKYETYEFKVMQFKL